MSKSLFLIRKHCPNLFRLLVENRSSDLERLDFVIEKQLENKKDSNTSLIRLLLRVEGGKDPFLKSFANYIDDLIGEMIQLLPSHASGIWDSLSGKITNIEGWNFLNPIGELSALKQLLFNQAYSLLTMEVGYPNGRSKDFHLKFNGTKQEFFVEVVNIHIPIEVISNDEVITMVLDKINNKIMRETEGVTDVGILDKLIIMPVVWYFNVETIRNNQDFFNSFSTSNGTSFSLAIKSFGFHTYIKTPNNRIIFGDAATILKMA